MTQSSAARALAHDNRYKIGNALDQIAKCVAAFTSWRDPMTETHPQQAIIPSMGFAVVINLIGPACHHLLVKEITLPDPVVPMVTDANPPT